MTNGERSGVVIDRPVEEVWAYMVDVSNMSRWEDSGAVWKLMSEGQIQVGTLIQSGQVPARGVTQTLVIPTTTSGQLAMSSPAGTSSADGGLSMRAIDSALK